MKKTILLIFSFLLISNFGMALGPKEKDIELSALMGKRIFQSPLNEWLEKYSYKTATEELQTDGPVLIIKNYEKGYSMLLDINMTLNSISVYNKGGKYQAFKGKLPLNLKFGMKRDSLYQAVDLRLEDVEDNPYVLTRKWNNQLLQLLFTSKGLNQVNVLAKDTIYNADDFGFIRLIYNGTVESGDCDSLKGKMTWNNGAAEYEGEWENNLPHGKGYFKDQNNNWYKGDFKYGYFWGKGQLSVANLYLYQGDFIMSRRQGNGICKFFIQRGERYEGQWKEDKMNGLGKYMKNSKNYYYGNMSNDKYNGNGKLVTPDGWIEGPFRNGLPNGFLKQYLDRENVMIEGEWVIGKREGKFKFTNMDNKKESYRFFENDIEIIDK